MYSFPNFEPVSCSVSSPKCRILTRKQEYYQEAGKKV